MKILFGEIFVAMLLSMLLTAWVVNLASALPSDSN